jgi:hypothetical protein
VSGSGLRCGGRLGYGSRVGYGGRVGRRGRRRRGSRSLRGRRGTRRRLVGCGRGRPVARRTCRGGRVGPRRKKAQRVEVPVLVCRDPDPEVHVGHVVLGVAAHADRSDDGSLADRRALRDGNRAEVGQRHRKAVGGEDAHRAPVTGNGAGEGHDPARRRSGGRALVSGDVDTAVLAARVRVTAEGERPQDSSLDRPRPRQRGAGQDEADERDGGTDGDHSGPRSSLRCSG